MEAVILAGGRGTRLKATLPGIPKPMAPVEGKPFLWYVLKWLSGFSVERAVLSTGYKSEVIQEYFGDRFESIRLEYAVEKNPLGTGGGMMKAAGMLMGQDFIVINGDTFFPVDLEKLAMYHTVHCGFITIALKKMYDFSRYGTVECNNDIIVRFNEKKPCHEGLINGGIYIVNRRLLMTKRLPAAFSLEKEILEKDPGKGDLRSMVFDDTFLDIGIPEDYKKAAEVLRNII